MERASISITSEEMSLIVSDESSEFEVIEDTVTGEWRHGTEHIAIAKRDSDHKLFAIYYRNSPKDMDFSDMNNGGSFKEVFPVTKTIISYE